MAKQKTRRQFGLWGSPITPLSMARGSGFSDLAWDQDGTLVWLESRSDRGVLVLQPPDGQAPRDLNSEYSVRGKVGYGGGEFTVGQGDVYFVEADSGRIYRQSLGNGTARPITPAFGGAASPALSPGGRWLLFVHTYEGQDSLGVVDSAGKHWPQKLVSGDDFYMQPAWHPDGERVAWIAWNHPNMPWDGTLLRMASIQIQDGELPVVKNTMTIAGDESTSIFQPEFSPDGRYLIYVSDASGWWQIYIYDLVNGKHHQLTNALAEHGEPAWVQGTRMYQFAPDGKSLFFLRNQDSFVSLWQMDLESRIEHNLDMLGYTFLDKPSISPDGKQIALIASAGDIPTRIITRSVSNDLRVWRRSISEELPSAAYAVPQAIDWPGKDGGSAHGLFYLPHNEQFEGIGKPPLITLIHGGPTSQRLASFNAQAQFFTSRGYAVLDVNYRGSTGYGREYRNMLRGNWGIFDVQDAVSGAESLIERGQVDGARVVIMGGSAGGFTVLKALEDYPGFFKSGICLYGVSNQFTLAAETHKFEERYNDSLLGPLPEASELYRERSPIYFVDRISDPIAIFQGEEDRVVPRKQSDEVVESLQRRGVSHIYHVYPGEGHGFRKAETIEHFYQAVEQFLKQYVIFA